MQTFQFDGKDYLFPTTSCSRCGGSGRYSWCQMYGDRCFGCGGSGARYVPGKVAKIAAEYTKTVKAQKEATAQTLVPGDKVLDTLASSAAGGEQWVAVESVTIGDVACGRSKNGSFDDYTPWMVTAWNVTVKLVDGTEREMGGNQIVRRQFTGEMKSALVEQFQAQLPRKYQEVAA